MIELLFEPFRFPFMLNALLALLALSAVAALVGVLVNLRGLEFLGDGLTHSVFPGLVIGFLIAGRPGLVPGAVLAALAAAVALTLITARHPKQSDAAIAIVFTALFSIGVVLISQQSDYISQLEGLLFGRLLTITQPELLQLLIVLALGLLLVVPGWKGQLLRAFDAEAASAQGYRPLRQELLLNGAIAVVVVAASSAVGNLLALAVLILPAATARLLSRRIGAVVLLSALLGALSAWLGLVANYGLSVGFGVSIPSGATVVLTMVVLYVLALLIWLLVQAAALLRGRRSAAARAEPQPRAAVAPPREVSA